MGFNSCLRISRRARQSSDSLVACGASYPQRHSGPHPGTDPAVRKPRIPACLIISQDKVQKWLMKNGKCNLKKRHKAHRNSKKGETISGVGWGEHRRTWGPGGGGARLSQPKGGRSLQETRWEEGTAPLLSGAPPTAFLVRCSWKEARHCCSKSWLRNGQSATLFSWTGYRPKCYFLCIRCNPKCLLRNKWYHDSH